MPYIFDSQARQDAALADPDEQDRLEELIYRRYRSIDTTLARCRPIDPIIYEIEDNRGRPRAGRRQRGRRHSVRPRASPK